MSLREEIEKLSEKAAGEFTESDRTLFLEFKEALNRGEVRAAERDESGEWSVNSWVKRGILAGFRMGTLTDMSPADNSLRFFDKDTYPVRALSLENNVRIVPGGSSIRDGAYVAPGVVCMPPMYVNVGAYVDEGDEVLLPDPGFVAYPTIVRMAGGLPRFYRLPRERDFGFDAEDFRRSVTNRTKVVVLISPSNPTGRTLNPHDLAMISAALEGTNVYVISDEIYRELYYTEEQPSSISDLYARTLVIGGLSKSMSMTGWRIGWLCGGGDDEDVIKSALILHGYVTTCASTISQKAALSAAWTIEAEQARALTRQIFRERRDYLLALLNDVPGWSAVAPDGAFYTMVRTGVDVDSLKTAETLLAHGVITVPGVAFGSEGEGYLRVSFCAERDVLAEGVRRMSQALS